MVSIRCMQAQDWTGCPRHRFHRRILWLIGGGMFLDSFDIYLAGGVLGALARSGWSSMTA